MAREKALLAEARKTETKLRQQKAQLEALRQVGLELAAELEIDALLESIIIHAVEILRADNGSLWFFEPEKEALQLMTNFRSRFPVGLLILPGEGVTGKVWESGQPMIVKDYANWPEQLKLPDVKTLSSSIVAVPVFGKKEVLGVISVGVLAKDAFGEDDIRLLELFAAQAAVAIANARLHAQLKQYSEDLEFSNRELQDFAYVASHDLQEPLRKIQAFSDRLEERYGYSLDPRGLDYLHRMKNAASRMQKLIVDLLAISKVTSQARPFTSVNLNQVLDHVLIDLEIQVEENKAQIEISDLPTIKADETQMRQLFQNLISNALKFSNHNQPPIIRIKSRPIMKGQDLSHYVITVADNGIGFDEKHAARIFGVFKRLHGQDAYEGTGIGLAVCQKIVARHSGTITARSQPGEGATFTITLPVQPKE